MVSSLTNTTQNGKLNAVLTILAALLFAQLFSLAHSAEYGADLHEHDGALCTISQNAVSGGDYTPAAPDGLPSLHRRPDILVAARSDAAVPTAFIRTRLPRAPPA